MRIIRKGRGEGKTTELIKISNKEWKYIVCVDHTRAEYIAYQASQLGLDIPFPITYNELPLNYTNNIKSVLIDDMEELLAKLIKKPIDYATTSCEVIHSAFTEDYDVVIENQKLITLKNWLTGRKYLIDEHSTTMTGDFEDKHKWQLATNCMINETINKINELVKLIFKKE